MFTPTPQHIESCNRLRILTIGDVMLDHYLRGSIERTSPEAPVGVLGVESEEYILGGAANVARNLAAMRARVDLVGVVGADAAGTMFLALLEEAGIGSKGILKDASRPTTLKTRAVAQGQQVLRIDRERKASLSPTLENRLIESLRKRLPQYDGILVSDYGKGLLTDRVLRTLATLAKEFGKPILCDPKGLEYRRYKGFDILTPNQKEAQGASGVEIRDEASLARAAGVLNRQIGGRGICITRGAQGATVFSRRGAPRTIPPFPREVFDVTGAGDTFISHLTLGFLQGLDLGEAAAWANLAAGIVVERQGVAVVTPRELLAEIHGDRRYSKYIALGDLEPLCRTLKAAGQRIVMTNGCFDLLHIGHIRLMESARALGDCLIVAINSDASVRSVKGPPRPLLPEAERIALLAALDAVDYVIVFEETSPEMLIRTLRPDILVKGGNLDPDEVVGRRIVESYGGKVHLIPAFGDRSITQFLERLVPGPSRQSGESGKTGKDKTEGKTDKRKTRPGGKTRGVAPKPVKTTQKHGKSPRKDPRT